MNLREGEDEVLAVLIISLLAALLTGAALFARGTSPHGHVLDVTFGISVAVFLATLLIVLVRKAVLTLQNDECDRDSTSQRDDRSSRE